MHGTYAGVAKLVDARDLKSLGLGCAGSIPAARTSLFKTPDTKKGAAPDAGRTLFFSDVSGERQAESLAAIFATWAPW
jgi:hypothetical protein